MTDIRKAAEEHFDRATDGRWRGWPDHQREDALEDFEKGYRAGLERAAQEIETAPFKEHYLQCHERLSAARLVRKIGEGND